MNSLNGMAPSVEAGLNVRGIVDCASPPALFNAGIAPAMALGGGTPRSSWASTYRIRIPALVLALLLLSFISALRGADPIDPTTGLPTAGGDLTALLHNAMAQETVHQNLPAALAAYQQITNRFQESRIAMATALLRMGDCLRNLGRTKEALQQYERLETEFPDQTNLTKMAGKHSKAIRAKTNGASATFSMDPILARRYGLVVSRPEASSAAPESKELENASATTKPAPPQTGFPANLDPAMAARYGLLVRPNANSVGGTVAPAPANSGIPTMDSALAARYGLLRPPSTGTAVETTAEPAGGGGGSPNRDSALGGTVPSRIPLLDLNAEDDIEEISRKLKFIESLTGVEHALAIQSAFRDPLLSKLTDQIHDAKFEFQQRVQELSGNEEQEKAHEALKRKVSFLQQSIHERQEELLLSKRLWIRMNEGKNAPSTQREPLVSAEEALEIKRIQAIVANSPDLINAWIPAKGGTLLHEAAGKGHVSVVEFLIEKGANIRGTYAQSTDTPLHRASQSGHLAVARRLMDAGADPNAVSTSRGATPLHLAAEKGYLRLVESLAPKTSDIDLPDLLGKSPLSYACAGGHLDTVECLLKYKANPNRKSTNRDIPEWEITPLAAAVSSGHPDVVRLLLKHGGDVHFTTDSGSTLLMLAGRNQKESVILELLKSGVDVKGRKKSGETVLSIYLKAPFPRIDLIRTLLNAGVDPNSMIGDGHSVLAFAITQWGGGGAWKGGVAEELLKWKADPNLGQSSPLYLAAVSLADEDLVKELLKAGANPNLTVPRLNRTTLELTTSEPIRKLLQEYATTTPAKTPAPLKPF